MGWQNHGKDGKNHITKDYHGGNNKKDKRRKEWALRQLLFKRRRIKEIYVKRTDYKP